MDSCVVCGSILQMGRRGYGCGRCYITYTRNESECLLYERVYYTYRQKKVLFIGGDTECVSWCEKYDGAMDIVDYIVFPKFHTISNPIEVITHVLRKCNTHTLIIMQSEQCTRDGIGYSVYGIKRLCDLLGLFVVHVNVEACVYIISCVNPVQSNVYDIIYRELESYNIF
ncbi:hypothetical protein EBU95_02395 [bacterium]|nr:hypothetical protein [bacterium]